MKFNLTCIGGILTAILLCMYVCIWNSSNNG